MKSLIIFFVCLAAVSGFEECGKRGSTRIVNGQDASPGEFPWQISLQIKSSYPGREPFHTCGATLISDRWVLSAAHCFNTGTTRPKSSYRVRIGEWKLRSGGEKIQDFKITELYIHEKWNIRVLYQGYDIALAKLDRPVDLSGPYAGTACLPSADEDYRGAKDCVLSGWGFIQKDPKDPRKGTRADQLQKAVGDIWDGDKLKDLWANTKKFPPAYRTPGEKLLGFGVPGSWSACQGDSGGPLVCKNKSGSYAVVGIVSYGPPACGTAGSGLPGMFTEVEGYLDWIKNKIDNSVDGGDGGEDNGGDNGGGDNGGGDNGGGDNGGGDGDRGRKACQGHGTSVPHETDCEKFYLCTRRGGGVLMRCPAGTRFDKKRMLCDFPHKVQC